MASGFSAKWMRLAKGSNFIKLTRFRANLRAAWPETTNSESPPGSGSVAEEYVYGVFGGDIDLEAVYQISDTLFSTLQPGTENSVTFYPYKLTTGTNITGTLCVETWEITGEIKDAIKVHIAGKFTGGYTANSL